MIDELNLRGSEGLERGGGALGSSCNRGRGDVLGRLRELWWCGRSVHLLSIEGRSCQEAEMMDGGAM
jgi:hypothetical protein